jgi:hypothetical protein
MDKPKKVISLISEPSRNLHRGHAYETVDFNRESMIPIPEEFIPEGSIKIIVSRDKNWPWNYSYAVLKIGEWIAYKETTDEP